MRILAVIHNFNWEYDNHIQTLKDMGHDVVWYDWAEYGYDQYSNDWLSIKRTEFNNHIVKFIKEKHNQKPIDLFFSHLSDPMINLDTLKEIKTIIDCPMVNFAWNDYTAFPKYAESCRGYDLNWTCIKAAAEFYSIAGVPAKYIPPAVNPKPYELMNIPPYGRDLSFIGQPYGYRKEILDYLSQHYGYSFSSKISFSSMVRQMGTSKINLGFCGFKRINDDVKQLRLRDFEVPACYGFYLTEHCDDLAELFEEGKEVVTYTTVAGLLYNINYYLENNEERELIRNNAWLAVINRHTWKHRFEQLFNILGV